MKEYVPFVDVRAVFEKTGAAMYFSHLDLSRAVSRALRRSKLNIWLTEGFSPRPHLVFTPPLPLGYESTCEIMDFRLNLGARLDIDAFESAFPPALKVRDVYFPETKLKDIAFAKYSINFSSNADENELTKLFSEPVMMVKRTKRSEANVDITKFIKDIDITKNDGIINMVVTLSCSGTESLSPAYVINAITEGGFEVTALSVCRSAFYSDSMEIFR